MTAIVLNDGSHASKLEVETITSILKRLVDNPGRIGAVVRLHAFCVGSLQQLNESDQEILISAALLRPDGTLPESFRNVIRNAIETDGIEHFELVSPVSGQADTVGRADGREWAGSLGERSGRILS